MVDHDQDGSKVVPENIVSNHEHKVEEQEFCSKQERAEFDALYNGKNKKLLKTPWDTIDNGSNISPDSRNSNEPFLEDCRPEEENTEAAGSGGGNDNGNDRPCNGEIGESPMPLLEHLSELRKRFVRVFVVIGVAFFVCYGFADVLFFYLARPLIEVMPKDTKLIFTGVPEGFFVYLKVAFVAAIFIASPYIFYQVWMFIAPGLYDNEKKYIVPLALFSAILFLAGSLFCYFVVFPFAFTFFMGYSTDTIVAMPSLNEYLAFSLKLLLAFGLIFEMPLFAFFLAKMKLITATKMRAVRKYAILVIFIVAAILTPPDVFSQILMAIPMLFLYELSIGVAHLVQKSG